MREPITASEMRALEHEAIASGRVTGLELMERAGQGVVAAIFEQWPELASAAPSPPYLKREEGNRAMILCGPGNNGGDGFVVARLLFELGWDVHLSLFGGPERLPPDARANYEAWSQLGETNAFCDFADAWAWRDTALGWPRHIFIDALFGIGLRRPIEGDLAALTGHEAEKANSVNRRVVSIDVPSGLDADKGAILGHDIQDQAVQDMLSSGRSFAGFRAIKPELTVTFHAPKHGHLQGLGPWLCGTLHVVDIGL